MNTEQIAHPKLQHFGLTTSNLNEMINWYRKVVGMTVNHRARIDGPQNSPWFSAAFVSNDDCNHRIAMFEMPDLEVDPDKKRHARIQHVAFAYNTLDDLLGTYIRLKGEGILPVMAADQGIQMVLYYCDPDQNSVELNVNNYSDEWIATEHLRNAQSNLAFVDPEKLVAARKAGASAWELHERAVAGEFMPDQPYDGRKLL
ncbi:MULTISPECIES: VOC family protein [unclassified Mesorhizobium]|uniref:VOC family protein n=1 Tax=unclassified Mesorhizobium TaxID=325217 RepID=UPI0015E440EF|nr:MULTISPECIES: VOC family protein [unclassified Mesorhizobium]